MKILIDIPDNKEMAFMDVMRNISYAKTKQITDAKAEIMADIKEAVEEIKLIKQGKLASRDINDLLNEL